LNSFTIAGYSTESSAENSCIKNLDDCKPAVATLYRGAIAKFRLAGELRRRRIVGGGLFIAS
jgi:hypothetical protein